MKRRDVVFSPEAVDDLDALFDFVRDNAGAERASAWLGRLEAHCQSYDFASERGASRNDVRHGLRISSFERRITIAFTVTPTQVVFLRFFYAGSNWEATLAED